MKCKKKRPRIITVAIITVYQVRAGDEYSRKNPVQTFKRK